MNKHTITDLYQMQSLPLSAKIRMTENRIRWWYDYFNGDVYVSFSGGKDSTVLVDIVTKMGYTDIPLVFVDTGLEYPEIREFVKGYGDRVTWLRPKMNFKQVIEKYGYPMFTKEASEAVDHAREYLRRAKNQDSKTPYKQFYEKITGTGRYEKGGKCKEGEPSRAKFSQKKYEFMLDAPFEISNKCCNVMKKEPTHRYAKETGRTPIMAQMASESLLRTQKWLQHGCNGFDMKSPISNPMAFWTDQDVLLYIKENNLKIAPVYGDVVETEEYKQMTLDCFLDERPYLKTTGCQRTGCMFCGYGCHAEKGEGRFQMMKRTHPKQYEWIMKPWSEGGLGYKDVIDWINEHGNINIRY